MAKLEQLRLAKPLTQRELAEAAGVSENTVWLIENGRSRNPRPRVMRAIAAALGVAPGDVDEFRPSLQLGLAEEELAEDQQLKTAA